MDSSGWDEIPTSVIKASASLISLPLSCLINQSLLCGVFPSKLKYAIIKPLFKSKDPTNVSNYRPIALLPVMSKIFEKVFLSRVVGFLDKHNILNKSQFGFRENSSTSSAVYSFTNLMLKLLDSKDCVASILCDLSKAFDCVNHKVLLRK